MSDSPPKPRALPLPLPTRRHGRSGVRRGTRGSVGEGRTKGPTSEKGRGSEGEGVASSFRHLRRPPWNTPALRSRRHPPKAPSTCPLPSRLCLFAACGPTSTCELLDARPRPSGSVADSPGSPPHLSILDRSPTRLAPAARSEPVC